MIELIALLLIAIPIAGFLWASAVHFLWSYRYSKAIKKFKETGKAATFGGVHVCRDYLVNRKCDHGYER